MQQKEIFDKNIKKEINKKEILYKKLRMKAIQKK